MSRPVVLVFVNRDRLEAPLREHLDRLLDRLAPLPEPAAATGVEAPPPSVADSRARRQRAQRAELLALLEQCGGNLAEVARRLGKSRGAVIYRARKYGLLAAGAPRRRGGGSRSR